MFEEYEPNRAAVLKEWCEKQAGKELELMNSHSQLLSQGDNDFPEVGENPLAEQPKRDDRKGFKNPLFPNDSVTTCSGFINEIRSHQKGDDVLYFVRVGLIQGSRKNDHDDWQGDITNCDLLVGSTLRKWAESMKKFKDPFAGIRVGFVIRNLKFTPGLYEDKPVLYSRGVLEAISIGHLDQ